MNKKFLQSVTTGLVSLTLAASCAKLGLKKESNSCNTNSCAAKKKEETNKCSSKEVKKEVSKEVKKENHKCASKDKKAKKAEKKAEAKEEKKN